MIEMLNGLVEAIESDLGSETDVEQFARSSGTTGYHLRRMFSALAGIPVSEYVRRRRMTAAANELLGDQGILEIAVRYGYTSSEAFGRAFRAVHGSSPAEVRRSGGPLRSQPPLRFHLAVEGNTPMESRIEERPAFLLVGHRTRVPLVHEGPNQEIVDFITGLPAEAHTRLTALSTGIPRGILQITDGVDPDYAEGSELDYLHGVALRSGDAAPADLSTIDVAAGPWAVFSVSGPYPSALQATWAATASSWFPSHPWRLRPGPSMVAVIERAEDFSTARCELWLPVERE